MSTKASSEVVLGVDLGGTKVALGFVSRSGKLSGYRRVLLNMREGKKVVLRQIIDECRNALDERKVAGIGIASAGPLDPIRGLLLDPSNFKDKRGTTWGRVDICKTISRATKAEVFLDNDAAAAALAESWVGSESRKKNLVVLTLGTGLGVGVIANGELVRAGRMLHPEGGHLIVGIGDQTAKCGCGNYGCAEAYLSGVHFERRAKVSLKSKRRVSGKEIFLKAQAGDQACLKLFHEYSSILAHTIHNFCVIYCPETVILTGSFAATSPAFLAKTQLILKKLLARRREGVDLLPRLKISSLENTASVIGAGAIAWQNLRRNAR